MTEHQIYLLAAIIGITATSVLTRGAFVLLPQRWQLPTSVQAPLRYAPMAAIAAIVAPDLFAQQAPITAVASAAFWLNAKLWGAAAGAAAYVRFGNMGGAIAAGMAGFWGVKWALTWV